VSFVDKSHAGSAQSASGSHAIASKTNWERAGEDEDIVSRVMREANDPSVTPTTPSLDPPSGVKDKPKLLELPSPQHSGNRSDVRHGAQRHHAKHAFHLHNRPRPRTGGGRSSIVIGAGGRETWVYRAQSHGARFEGHNGRASFIAPWQVPPQAPAIRGRGNVTPRGNASLPAGFAADADGLGEQTPSSGSRNESSAIGYSGMGSVPAIDSDLSSRSLVHQDNPGGHYPMSSRLARPSIASTASTHLGGVFDSRNIEAMDI